METLKRTTDPCVWNVWSLYQSAFLQSFFRLSDKNRTKSLWKRCKIENKTPYWGSFPITGLPKQCTSLYRAVKLGETYDQILSHAERSPRYLKSSPVKHQESVMIPKSPFYNSVIAWSNIKTKIASTTGSSCRGKPSEVVPLTFLQSPSLLFFGRVRTKRIKLALVWCTAIEGNVKCLT